MSSMIQENYTRQRLCNHKDLTSAIDSFGIQWCRHRVFPDVSAETDLFGHHIKQKEKNS